MDSFIFAEVSLSKVTLYTDSISSKMTKKKKRQGKGRKRNGEKGLGW